MANIDMYLNGVARFGEADDASRFGGKSYSLSMMARDGLPVPPGYALDPEISSAIANRDPAAIALLEGLLQELGSVVAVRSSGLGEDGVETSFAGQHATVLGVDQQDKLIDAISTVVSSASTQGASAYRNAMEIDQTDRIAVAVQKLALPEFAGVLFTRNPVSGADERVIESVFGLGEALVGGLVTPAQYRVARGGKVISEEPGYQDIMLKFEPGHGVRQIELQEDLQESLMLTAQHITDLDRLANDCERLFGGPQDIEWCIEKDMIYLLQSRPITTL